MALQLALAPSVREEPLTSPVRAVAGVDVSIRDGQAYAAVVVLKVPALTVADQAVVSGPIQYPYVPGLLAFREVPLILRALQRLREPFDVLMTDGHGRVHPRRFGLACHIGVLLDTPAIGVAKRPYIGIYSGLSPDKGAAVPLRDPGTGEVLGMAVRTRSGVQPVYVSVGHGVTLPEAVQLTLESAVRYRMPEVTRQAHLLSRRTFS